MAVIPSTYCGGAVLAAVMVALTGTARAQPMPPPPGQSSPETAPAAPAARSRPATGHPTDVSGNWSGPVAQVGGDTRYTVVMKIAGSGGQTDYPELNCGGKLTRVGASKSYVFFIEVITRGNIDKGGRCPDGTITAARAGDNLNWEWFGSINGDIVLAYGTLSRKTGP